jgi:O-antigen/teichoic acid export membrane protein
MVFLLASFTAIRNFLDMGSSVAFFTFLSQRPRTQRFVIIYWSWVGIQLMITLALVTLLLPAELISNVWLGAPKSLLVFALIASFMQGTVWSLASQMAEASRETVRLQRTNTVVVSVHLSVVVFLWFVGELALPLIFLATFVEWSLASWFAARLYRTHEKKDETSPQEQDTVKNVWREFFAYCLPLIPYGWLSFAYEFADRWMLQNWGGSKEQAYYGLALQISGVALIATTSILRVFWKEIAEAFHAGDTQRVALLYEKVSRLLYFTGAAVTGGMLPWTAEILQITVGAAYVAGTTTVMLMLCYPVHQSIGQITGTLLYATGHVRIQVVLGMIQMSLSLLVSYLMMAPTDAFIPGLGLASQGLAWKMVILQLIGVNVAAWVIAHLLGAKYDWHYQVVALGGCMAFGWLAYILIQTALGIDYPVLLRMGIAGFLYAFCVIAFLYALPWIAGTTRGEIRGYSIQLVTLLGNYK